MNLTTRDRVTRAVSAMARFYPYPLLGERVFWGVVTRDTRHWKRGDVALLRVNNGEAERFPAYGFSSRYQREVRLYTRYKRWRDSRSFVADVLEVRPKPGTGSLVSAASQASIVEQLERGILCMSPDVAGVPETG